MVCGMKYANHSPNEDSIIESRPFNLDYGVYAVSMRTSSKNFCIINQYFFPCLKINKWMKKKSLTSKNKISYFHNDTTLGHLPNAMV